MFSKILIVDYGSQLTQLIAKRIRENQVYSEIYPFDFPFETLDLDQYKGFIFSGGPYSSVDTDAPAIPAILKNKNLPIMGICYGSQRLTFEEGGDVHASTQREFGHTNIIQIEDHPIFKDIPDKSVMWMSHSDHITKPGKDFQVLAKTEKPIFLVQFHPEAYHSEYGKQLFKNFLDITGTEKNWTMDAFYKKEIDTIQTIISDQTVILGLSGGVDSLVTAVLLYKALGKNLQCVFIDHGLLRANEKEQVETYIKKHFEFPFYIIDAKKEFLDALQGIIDPEKKRKVIGKLFIEAFEKFVKQNIPQAQYLAQGTIYPDIIESAGNLHGKGQVIKSHHNVGGLPEKLSLKIIEPLKMLFKDEVRELGKFLEIPHELIYRHPFPGPGLAIRILGEIKQEYIDILQQADKIFIDELKKNDCYDKVSQAFCVFLPVRSVGVMGDNRSYDYTIAIRSVNTEDFMTTEFSKFSWEFLGKVSTRITNEVKGINRVVYDISNKPPATIEWE